MPLGLIEQIPHPAGTHAHEHLYELGARDREKWNAGLSGHRLGHECFAGAGGPDEQHTPGNACTKLDKFLRLFEKLHDLLKLFFGLVDPRYIIKGHRRLIAGKHTCATLPERQGLIVRSLRLAQHEEDQAYDQQPRQ